MTALYAVYFYSLVWCFAHHNCSSKMRVVAALSIATVPGRNTQGRYYRKKVLSYISLFVCTTEWFTAHIYLELFVISYFRDFPKLSEFTVKKVYPNHFVEDGPRSIERFNPTPKKNLRVAS